VIDFDRELLIDLDFVLRRRVAKIVVEREAVDFD